MTVATTKYLLSLRDAAAWVGCSPRTLAKLVDGGGGPPAYRLGERWAFDPDELLDWLTPADEPAAAASEGDALDGAGLAGFMLSFGILSILRGQGLLSDETIDDVFDGAMLALETIGVNTAERAAAHRLLLEIIRRGVAVPVPRRRSPYEVH